MRNTSLSSRLTSIYTQYQPTSRLPYPPTCDSKWTRPFSTTILLWGLCTDCVPVLDGTGRVLRRRRRVYTSGWLPVILAATSRIHMNDMT